MNPKIFISFALGVLVASGVAYYAAKPQPTGPVAATAPQPSSPSPSQPEPVAPAPAAPASPEPAPVVPSPPSEDPPKRASKPISKPAPIPARPAPVQTASNTPVPKPAPPSASPEPATAPAPVNQPLIVQDPPPPPPPSTPYHAPNSEPAPVKAPEPPPPPPKPNTVTIPAGTLLNVRLLEKLSSEKNQAGDSFSGTLDQPVVVDGFIIAERGSRVQGRIAELDRAGRVKGLARLVLELTQVNTTDGQRIRVQTSPFERKAESSAKKDAAKVGIGAAIGAAIGAIAGGGKGAATGAGVGGAAGAGQVLLTRGEAAELNVESRLAFRLQEPVTITEKLNN
jgi:hypothetical protein